MYYCPTGHVTVVEVTKEAISHSSTFSSLTGWILDDAHRQGDTQTDRQTEQICQL